MIGDELNNTGNKLSNDIALDFILGGSALFTVKNSLTGNHISYKVIKSKKADKNIYFVIKKDGQVFLGTIFDRNKFVYSSKSTSSIDSPEVKGFAFIFYKLLQKQLPAKVEIWHDGKCGRCGRTLTDPDSLRIGIGPECRRHFDDVYIDAVRGKRDLDKEYDRIVS